MTIVDRIKKLCENRKITIAELERNAGLKSSTIYRWDKNMPSGDKLEKVADYFNVSIDYLLGRDELINNAETTFEAFVNDPELLTWYSSLPEHDVDELRRLRALWELVQEQQK
ncbi:helix-turn-helix domain-containing protein [Listeria newyorkensis]|uniref:Helix-turn-helix transcriptional regulator n=1 Tax=Listeria newyorkensis TaxID=1497681 RepID=A0A841YT36_9LIST|nr:helix-turn-helix transcriptional regulator [Listeria newyorkensis]MBC1456249.1 helix-turn-helix transcriptional regulator [Listeria newyorkensis]